MARLLRVEYAGAIYHVTCRMVGETPSPQGNDAVRWPPRSRLFRDEADYQRFVERLAERVEQFHIRLFLFVCMRNHFHLVFETPEANGSRFMQSLSTAYAVYYNLRHGRHGHLLDGRFKAKLVEGDDYLLALSRYVHLNPVRIAPVRDWPIEERLRVLRAYPWSSYPSYISLSEALGFVEYGPLLAVLHGRRSAWPERYRKFVETGLTETDDDFLAALNASPHSIGSDAFRARIDSLYRQAVEKHARPEDVSFRRVSRPLPADEVLSLLAGRLGVEVDGLKRRRRTSPWRALASRCLLRHAGLDQRHVADLLHVGSGSAVSKHLADLNEKLKTDRILRCTVEEVERSIQAVKEQRRTQV